MLNLIKLENEVKSDSLLNTAHAIYVP